MSRKPSTWSPSRAIREHFPLEGKLRVYRSRTGGNEWEPLTNGLPQSDCYVNVLRDAMAVDSLDSCGVYFGTTGGQVYASADAGDNWTRHRARIFRPCFRSRCRRFDMIRVVLPAHLRTLAQDRRRGAARSRGAGDAALRARRAGGAVSDARAGPFAIT